MLNSSYRMKVSHNKAKLLSIPNPFLCHWTNKCTRNMDHHESESYTVLLSVAAQWDVFNGTTLGCI